MHIFEIENLTYLYPEASRPALDRLSLGIEEGELTLIAGASGAGKTTLARALCGIIPELYGGRIGGEVLYASRRLRALGPRERRGEIGFVSQEPERQLLMTTVEREIAFGPENLGLTRAAIARRVAEATTAFGLTGILGARTAELSGGMQQRVVLAATIAMEPRVLVLDEPTCQLDPVSAQELLELLVRLRDDLGCTVVLVEQRLEHCLPAADRVLFLQAGRVSFDGSPDGFCRWAIDRAPCFLPPVTRLFSHDASGPLPLTVREGRGRLGTFGHPPRSVRIGRREPGDPLIMVEKASFTYGNGAEAIRDVSLVAHGGEVLSILGANGAGKSTLLKLIAGILPASRGKISVMGGDSFAYSGVEKARRFGYLSQNSDDYLFHNTVAEEVGFTLRNLGIDDGRAVAEAMSLWGIAELAGRNPRELAAGERQRVALAAVTAPSPRVLLLDEPTRGLDPLLKERLGDRLSRYAREKRASVIVVTQDMEFAAARADRVALLFNGELVASGPPHEMFRGEPFYSSQVSRLFRGFAEGVVTLDEAREALGMRGET